MQKSAKKTPNIRKIGTIFNIKKNGAYAKAIAFAKSSIWVKK